MTGLEPSLETGVHARVGQGIRLAADLIRFALVFALVLLVSRNPLGSLALRGILLAEAAGFCLAFFLNPARWNLLSLGELLLLIGLWWLQERMAGSGAPECMESTAVVGLFFMVWLPLRGVPAVVRALRPDSDLEDEEEEE